MDFLLELLSEEIPARMQARAREDLARLFAAELSRAGLAASAIETFATPRRLALIARDLPAATAAVREETKGPRASAPPQALDGFLRKTGLTREALEDRDGILYAIVERPGRPTPALLAEAIPAIIRNFPWPKSMRWGAGTLRWVRPLAGIVALFGEDVVECDVDGIASGAATLGHRFHHPGRITIGSAADYAEKLRLCHVIVDPEERAAIIRTRAAELAAAAGLTVVPDEGLVTENAGLTEWPVPLLGRFDPVFLDVPREVIQLTMRTNQKYFALVDGAGALAPNFICTANIDAADGGALVVAGNEKVLSARLSDAKFFWEQDLRVPLAAQAEKLGGIVFHEKLGTVADKVERVAKLAKWLVTEGIVTAKPLPFRGGVGVGRLSLTETTAPAQSPHPKPSPGGEGPDLASLAEQAARLCKADLVTGMVGEFPELQGIIGGHLARAQGLPEQVADAIRDHYKPVGQGDEVPTAPVTVAVSLADKLDTVVSFFIAEELPTGSKDPFALRRSALALEQLIFRNSLRVRLFSAVGRAAEVLRDQTDNQTDYSSSSLTGDAWRTLFLLDPDEMTGKPVELTGIIVPIYWRRQAAIKAVHNGVPLLQIFLIDRLKVQQREAGVRHDLIDAVFALGGEDDLVRLLARVHALQAFITTDDGANLLAGYKRAANILRIEQKKDTASSAVTPAQAGVQSPAVEPDPGLRRGDGSGARFPTIHQIGYTPLPAEAALLAALDAAEPAAAAAVEAEDFGHAMGALAALRSPIDAFFEEVTVNDADPDKRAARLGLLARIRDAVHRVADFSRIEG